MKYFNITVHSIYQLVFISWGIKWFLNCHGKIFQIHMGVFCVYFFVYGRNKKEICVCLMSLNPNFLLCRTSKNQFLICANYARNQHFSTHGTVPPPSPLPRAMSSSDKCLVDLGVQLLQSPGTERDLILASPSLCS